MRKLPSIEALGTYLPRRNHQQMGNIATCAAVLAGLLAVPTARPPAEYVDCLKRPTAAASFIMDTLVPSLHVIGDASTTADGGLESWRQQLTIATVPPDRFVVATHGLEFGFNYEDVAVNDGVTSLTRNLEAGSALLGTVYNLPTPTSKSLRITFTCLDF